MTREEFLNIFVRKKNIARSIIICLAGLLLSVLIYCGIALWYDYVLFSIFPYFIGGWFIAEAITILYYFVFVYSKEKLKLNEQIIRDIIE